jgi:anti-sigma regulatory factor (Ser/Thr protein kinase)
MLTDLASNFYANPGSLRVISEWLAEQCSILSVSPRLSNRISVCLNETVANLIEHNHSLSESSILSLRLSFNRSDSVLEIQVIDTGDAFNPLEISPSPLPSSLDKATIGGVGLHLIKRLASACEYYTTSSCQNILSMTFGAS